MAIKKLAIETISPSSLLSANNGKSPSPLVAIPAAISAEIGKLGITINATATDIIPPQPGKTPIIADTNITKNTPIIDYNKEWRHYPSKFEDRQEGPLKRLEREKKIWFLT